MKEDTKPLKNIQPLSKPEHYRLWCVRVESALKQMKAWNVKTAAPMDTEESNNYLLSVIADNFLEQMLDTDLKASTIWAYLQKTILVSSISSQSTALSELMAFNYAESDMRANKTALLRLQRNLKTAFNNSPTIDISQLVTLFALVNIPTSYQPLRTTLEETKEKLELDELFTSLIREESSAVANGARAARVAVASPNQNFGPACGTKRLVFNVDSGATIHLINNKDNLTSQSLSNQYIATATNSTFKADHKGPIDTEELPIHEAHASTQLHENLLSINQLDNKGYDTLFSKGKVYIGAGFQTPKKYAVAGDRKNGAYYVTLNKSISTSNQFQALADQGDESTEFTRLAHCRKVHFPDDYYVHGEGLSTGTPGVSVDPSLHGTGNPSSNSLLLNSMDIAHLRLGHLHESAIKSAIKTNLLKDMDINTDDQMHPCISCMKGKARKGTPSRSNTSSKAVGDLIHMDICGPLEPTSYAGNRFILTALDDFSNMLHTWPLKTKGEAFRVISKFILHAKNIHGVKRIRTDNGGEFTSNYMKEFLASQGIQHQLTIRYSSHQNGKAERINLTLLDGIRTVLIASGISRTRWDEALNYITYTRNYSPSKSLKTNGIPLSTWTNSTPSFTHLRTFGETCFAVTELIDRRHAGSVKLSDRAVEGRFVGYSLERKGYRILLADGYILEATFENVRFLPPPRFAQEQNLHTSEGNLLHFKGESTTVQGAFVDPSLLSYGTTPHSDASAAIEAETIADSAENEGDSITDSAADEAESITGSESSSHDIFYDTPDLTQDELDRMHLTPIINRPGYFKDKYKGVVQLQDVSTPAPKSSSNPPQHSKRISRPPNTAYSVSERPCSCCIAGYIASEDNITPAAYTFMHMASLQWFKEVPRAAVLRASASDPTVPKNHFDISGREDESDWIKAEEEEIAQLIAMGTWELVPLPPNRKPIKSKWVYRKKTDAQGKVVRYKARLCACGYSQKAGIDFKEIYSPVFRMESSRLFLTIVASRKMKLIQMDVTGAFLNGPLQETIYMKQPQGYEDLSKADYVLVLLRNLYGLKQAPRVWHQTIHPFLVELGFKAMEADPCIYFQWDAPHKNLQLISLYVDNLGVAADRESDVERVRAQLQSKFTMTDEPDDQFLQMKFKYADGHMILSQTQAIDDLLVSTNMESALPVSTPMDALTVSKDDCPSVGSDEWHHMQQIPYRETIGSLSHICRNTRPDIAYAVSVASRYLANPGQKHWNLVKRILRYLKGTRDWEFHLNPGPLSFPTIHNSTQSSDIQGPVRFYGFSDSDWGGQLETSKSTTGYGFFLGYALVSWQSKTQSVTATSSTHAEYIAAYHAAAECIWARNFLSELGLFDLGPTTLHCDNEAAIKLSKFHMVTPRSKHFDTKFHYLREQVAKHTIDLIHCSGAENIADIWTKPLGSKKFSFFRTKLGVLPSSSQRVNYVREE
jgi:transposase InsO family protein